MKMSDFRKASGFKTRRGGFGHRRRRAGSVSGFDLDELLVNVARELLFGIRQHVLRRQMRSGDHCQEGESEHFQIERGTHRHENSENTFH